MIGVTAQRHGWESVGDVTVDGVPGGWGFLETTLNARNGSGAARLRAGRGDDQRHRPAVVRQPAEDRALYYRQLRADDRQRLRSRAHECHGQGRGRRWSTGFWPNSSSRRSGAPALSHGVRRRVRVLLDVSPRRLVTPERFVELRRRRPDVVAAEAGSDRPGRTCAAAANSSMSSAASSSVSTNCREVVLGEEHSPRPTRPRRRSVR